MTETPPRSDQFDLKGISVQQEEADSSEQWLPRLSPKQQKIFFDKTPILLIDGPRFSGKSIVLSHKAMKAAWEIYSANIGIFVSSYKVATDGGVWIDLLDAAKIWTEAEIESEYGYKFEITSIMENGEAGDKRDSKNRSPFFRIRNKWGTESIIRLFSISNENEIEKKVKSTRFQFLWLNELSNFKNREVIDISQDQLRPQLSHEDPTKPWHLKMEDCQLVADTNPAREGKKHWIFRWFYLRQHDVVKSELQEAADLFTADTGVITLKLEDNPFLSKEKKMKLAGKYASDPNSYQRFVEGEWPDQGDMTSVLFADVFSNELIVEGQIDVDDMTDTLYCGFDLGPRNKAGGIHEKRIVEGRYVWCVIDELVYVGGDAHGNHVSTEQFTIEFMEKMAALNKHYKSRRKNFTGFKWVCWSDSSSFVEDLKDEGATEAKEVYTASNGQIEMRAVGKPARSVESGCQMIRKLMREHRFFVGTNCPETIKSFQNLKRPSKGNFTIDPNDPLKHCADQNRYVIYAESYDDLMNDPSAPKPRDYRTIRIQM